MKRHFVNRDANPSFSHSVNTWTLKFDGVVDCRDELRNLVSRVLGNDELAHVVYVRPVGAQVVLVTIDQRRVADKVRDRLDGQYLGSGRRLRIDFVSQGEDLQLNYRRVPFAGTIIIDANGEQLTQVQVRYPSGIDQLRLIHRVVEGVVRHGLAFEACLMHKYIADERFEFLFNSNSADHAYYRWKLFMVLANDQLDTWPVTLMQNQEIPVPIELFKRIEFVPPRSRPPTVEREISRVDAILSSATHEPPNYGKNPILGNLAALHLQLLLQHVSYRRGSIARIMGFAVDHSEAAPEVVQIICNSICDSSTSDTTESRLIIARLWAIGDILCNVEVSSPYRAEFQKALSRVFEFLRDYYNQTLLRQGRITSERFKQQILDVLEAWAKCMVFTRHDLCGVSDLEDIFLQDQKREDDGDTQFELSTQTGVQTRDITNMDSATLDTIPEQGSASQPRQSVTRMQTPTPGPDDGDPLTEQELEFYQDLVGLSN